MPRRNACGFDACACATPAHPVTSPNEVWQKLTLTEVDEQQQKAQQMPPELQLQLRGDSAAAILPVTQQMFESCLRQTVHADDCSLR